jgi:hypothetical protein
VRVEGGPALPQRIALARFGVSGQMDVGNDHIDSPRSHLPPGFLSLLHRGGGENPIALWRRISTRASRTPESSSTMSPVAYVCIAR